jgi:hypothetical protein
LRRRRREEEKRGQKRCQHLRDSVLWTNANRQAIADRFCMGWRCGVTGGCECVNGRGVGGAGGPRRGCIA